MWRPVPQNQHGDIEETHRIEELEMFVNDVNSSMLQHQTHTELQQRAADERLAHEYLRAHRDDHRSLWARIGQLLGSASVAPRRHPAHHHAH